MSRNILVRPLVTEKTAGLMEKRNQYSFIVDKKANKIEIKKAVEEMYGVTVESVNTVIMPTRKRSRFTKRGFIEGRTKSMKKAFVTVSNTDTIDFYAEI
ncbi:MAG TPA: 50S ribosomal protein L23 [Chitinophagales bacterium]|nr:50S ribosomal protein L23 [Chitinophagales bacterium]HRK27601.1 50S ribosomal protein L23 [Chitinophagales bacterium]